MPIFIPLMCLLGMGVARFRAHAQAVPADPAARDDVPARVLWWAVSMLPAQREEWARRCSASWPTSAAGGSGGASRPARETGAEHRRLLLVCAIVAVVVITAAVALLRG